MMLLLKWTVFSMPILAAISGLCGLFISIELYATGYSRFASPTELSALLWVTAVVLAVGGIVSIGAYLDIARDV